MRDIFKGFLTLRLLGFVPLLIVILVLLGVSALARGSAVLGVVILAGVPVVVVAAFGWLMTRQAHREPRRQPDEMVPR